MKKKLGLILLLVGMFGLAACNSSTPSSSSVAPSSSSEDTTSESSSSSSEVIDGAIAKIDAALDGLAALITDPSNITVGFQVPTNLANGVTAVWSSSEPGVLSFGEPSGGFANVIVNRPALGSGDATLTISAVLSLQSELSATILTRNFSLEVTVKENPVAEVVIENVADILALVDPALDNTLNVSLENLTVIARSVGEAWVYDGTGVIQIYGAPTAMEVGKVYSVAGVIDWYYGIWEIKNVTATEQTEATPQFPVKEVIDSVDEKIAALEAAEQHLPAIGNVADGNMEAIHASVTGKVHVIPGDSSNYNTYLLDDTNTTGLTLGTGPTGTDPENPANGFMFYYGTNDFALIKSYDGIVITIDVVIYTYRSNNHAFAIYYVGGPEGIVAVLTDAQKQTIDANALAQPTSVTEATTLEVPTEGINGSTIAWASSNEAVINSTTGVVTIPEAGVMVTLTATVSITGLTDIVKTFNIVVGPLTNTDMATFLTKADNDVLYSEAEVLWAKTDKKAFVVGDSTGYGYIFNSVALDIVVGGFYGFNYTVDIYSGLYEMTKVTVLAPKGTDPNLTPTAVPWTATEASAISATAWSPSYVSMELVGYADGSYTNAFLADYVPKYVQTNGATADLQGKKFTATGWIIGNSSSKLTIQGTSYTGAVDATDAEKLAASVGLFKAPAANDAVTADLTLPSTVKFGTIAWTSSNTDVISNAGVVTRPASGEADVSLTMSYVITVGAVSSDPVAINYTVKAMEEVIVPPTPDLFISEYIEGSSNNKAIEIYNPTGAAVDLSQYTIKQYTNGATTTTAATTLSGTLAAGDVYVLANASANATILAQADYYPAYSTTIFSCGFNGDDAIALYKGETLIDLIGVIGVDPGTNWPVGDGATSEFTLVRASTIVVGNTTFTAAEWVVYPQDTFTYLGTHTVA